MVLSEPHFFDFFFCKTTQILSYTITQIKIYQNKRTSTKLHVKTNEKFN